MMKIDILNGHIKKRTKSSYIWRSKLWFLKNKWTVALIKKKKSHRGGELTQSNSKFFCIKLLCHIRKVQIFTIVLLTRRYFWKLLKGEFWSIPLFLGKTWAQITNSNNFVNLRNEVGEGKKVRVVFSNSQLKTNEL